MPKISLQSHGYPGLARAQQSLYGAARIGDFVVTNNYRLTRSGWAIVVLSAAALALGGCGRKGPLDLPPTAAGPSPAVAADSDTERANQPGRVQSDLWIGGRPDRAQRQQEIFRPRPVAG